MAKAVLKLACSSKDCLSTNINPEHPMILLVDDDDAILRLMTLRLEMQGYTVLGAVDPHHALKFAQQRELEIRLVVTDVMMPEMDGCELAARVKTIRPQMPILFVSGQDY